MLKIFFIYRIPECPYCHSKKTGRIIPKAAQDYKTQLQIQLSYMERGEYIRLWQPYDDIRNCFCAQCNKSWYMPYKGEFVSYKEKQEYLNSRNISEDIVETQMQLQQIYRKKHLSGAGVKLMAKAGMLLRDGFKLSIKYFIVAPIKDLAADLYYYGTGQSFKVKEEKQDIQCSDTYESLYKEYIETSDSQESSD